MEKRNAVLDFIKMEHRQIVELFQTVCQYKNNKPPKVRWDAYRDLRRAISRHSMAEEEVIYPRIKVLPEAEGLMRVAFMHHSFADRMIGRLDRMEFQSADWEKTLIELKHTMLAHMRLEEQEFKALLPLAFSTVELMRLGNKLKAGRAA